LDTKLSDMGKRREIDVGGYVRELPCAQGRHSAH
jgi:hypothetical protein